MLVVVADTSPIRYLVEIGHIELLPALFHTVSIPEEVVSELCGSGAPVAVRNWINAPPPWLTMHDSIPLHDPALEALDLGERAAISLGIQLNADIILIDERKGSIVAADKGFETTGTIGVLHRAAINGLVSFPEVFERLRRTNFRYPRTLVDALLARHRKP
ncbi:hypothetical protein F183_A37300 [Bryobacterales bacterium F-183]|nr:hypothetical protein F183_A37300 [Bryobacterales bacterium F-183]